MIEDFSVTTNSAEEDSKLDAEQEEYFRLIEQKKLNPREQLLRAYSLDGKYEPVSCIIPTKVLTAKAHTIISPDRLPHETDIPDGIIYLPIYQSKYIINISNIIIQYLSLIYLYQHLPQQYLHQCFKRRNGCS
jgi:hypothetical protein